MPEFSLTFTVKDSLDLFAIAAVVEAYTNRLDERPSFEPEGFCGFLLPLLDDGFLSIDGETAPYVKQLVNFSEDDSEMVVLKLREAADVIESYLELRKAKRREKKDA